MGLWVPVDPAREQITQVDMNGKHVRLRVIGINLTAHNLQCDTEGHCMEDQVTEVDSQFLLSFFFPHAQDVYAQSMFLEKQKQYGHTGKGLGDNDKVFYCGEKAAAHRAMPIRHYIGGGQMVMDLLQDLDTLGLARSQRNGARFVTLLNVGAGDNSQDDPLGLLQQQPFARGLLVEGDPEIYSMLVANLSTGLQSLNLMLSPSHVPLIIRALQNIFKTFEFEPSDRLTLDFLKVDIDSIDCVMADAILNEVNANFVIIEINRCIPPPVRYALLRSDYAGSDTEHGGPVFGCSLSYMTDMMARHGFELVTVADDAVFAHSRILSASRRLSVDSLVSPLAEVREPLDEFECYRRIVVLTFVEFTLQGPKEDPVYAVFPTHYVRDWLFNMNALDSALAVWGNITETHRDRNFAKTPFAFGY